MNLNIVQICGRITKKPELRVLPSGQAVCSVSMATNRTWKDQGGAKKTAADFHSVVVFGKRGEAINQYCNVGDEIYVSGRLQTRAWDAPDGSKRYKTEIIALDFQFGQKKKAEGAPASQGAAKTYDDGQPDTVFQEDQDIDVNNIPF
jgi:single stranded DNA-binding protein (ssb)